MAAKHVDFAELLRSLASAASRRGVLVGLTSSLLAGVPLGLDLPIAGAKKGESEDWFAGYQLSAISGWLVPTPDSRLPTYDSSRRLLLTSVVRKDTQMDARRIDQLAKTFATAGSRRLVIGGLLGAVLALSRIGAAGANHKPGHHCTPSDQHACPAPQTCREVNGEWTCQDPEITCLAAGSPCTSDTECCQDQLAHVFCCQQTLDQGPICDTDCMD